ncbi:MAG: hypothetical protein DWQ40_10175 [Actinobacteria bacterium]|nr:MAG: hypothetical protein DWQ40_10175 [Actinomycetota bacterium]
MVWEDRPPTEKAVIRYFDPVHDLATKAERSGYQLDDASLPSLARFAADLAESEGRHWASGDADLATRAYEARRFLVGDRVIHWAVPWLDAVGRCYPGFREDAHADRDALLEIADEMRVEPVIPGQEGLVLEGEDAFGRIEPVDDLRRWLTSLWSGHLILKATWTSLRSEGDEPTLDDLALLYEAAAPRWRGVAQRHPGSAQIWIDLATRAERTEKLLRG